MFIMLNFRRVLLPLIFILGLTVLGIQVSRLREQRIIRVLCSESTKDIDKIYWLRAKALMSHNTDPLKAYYDLSNRAGNYAYTHEETRCKYIYAWEKARDVDIVDVISNIRVTKVTDLGNKRVLRLRQTLFVDYIYKNQTKKAKNRFAIDTLHALTIKKRDKRWIIAKEWYLDPLKEDTIVPDVMPDIARIGIGKVRMSSNYTVNSKIEI